MQKLPINLVQPGMVLAKAVIKDNGMALCAEGSELTAALIERLVQMNISSLTVKGHPIDLGEQPMTLEDRIRELEARFARIEDDPLMMQVRDAISQAMLTQAREDQEIEERERADSLE